MKKVCIVGGGAAGLMAAYAAAKNGNDVLLFEKNEKLGKKIYITGKGRCNITNDISPDEFLENVVRGRKFLTGAVWSFPPKSVMEFFISHGLPLKTERGGRVFPVSDHASDVTKTLEKACRSVGVQFLLNEKVVCLQTSMSDVDIMPRIVAVRTEKGKYECGEAIVCMGGLSYIRRVRRGRLSVCRRGGTARDGFTAGALRNRIERSSFQGFAGTVFEKCCLKSEKRQKVDL